MAKEKPRCVMCGEETEFFRRATLPFYNTNQVVCTPCRQRYDSAPPQKRGELKERILASPYLWDRERIESLLSWKREEEQRVQEKENQKALKAVQREKAAVCCGRSMTELGVSRFQLGEYDFLLGHWSNLNSGSMELCVYQCALCGQVKFFKPVSNQS